MLHLLRTRKYEQIRSVSKNFILKKKQTGDDVEGHRGLVSAVCFVLSILVCTFDFSRSDVHFSFSVRFQEDGAVWLNC